MLLAAPSPTPPSAGLLATDVQIWAASATTGAVCIALIVAVISLVQRHNDHTREGEREEERARAQARLVVLANNFDLESGRPAPETALRLNVTNYGDRAILEVVGEAWVGGADLTMPPTTSEGPAVVPAGADRLFILALAPRRGPAPGLAAWRVRWMDADGRPWCLDHLPQDTPAVYSGQAPTPY